jgi:hypothetical protein
MVGQQYLSILANLGLNKIGNYMGKSFKSKHYIQKPYKEK